jgi:predicted nucleic acid-binding protein
VSQYLLDTNVISELRKTRPHGAVLAWVNAVQEGGLFLSAVTFGELQAGIERARQQDPAKSAEIERWIDALPSTFQVLPMDRPCFREWGRIMYKKPPDLLQDAMIAATARVHRLIVATRNERDFKQLDVKTFNPFKN